MEQKIERLEVRELESLHLSEADPLEVPFHSRGRDVLPDERIILRLSRDQPHIPRVAFVARPGMRYLEKLDLHLRCVQFSVTITCAFTASFGIRAGQ